MKIANLSIIDRMFTSNGRKLSKLAKTYMPGAKGLTYRKNVKTGADILEISNPKNRYHSAYSATITLHKDNTATFKHVHVDDWQNYTLGQNCETFIVEHINPKGKIDAKTFSHASYYKDSEGKKVILEKTINENGNVRHQYRNEEDIAKYKESDYYKNRRKMEYSAGNIWSHLNTEGNYRREHGIVYKTEYAES